MNRLEFKAALGIDDTGTLTGIAWPFGSADRVGDEIQKGAFASSPSILPMLAFHDPASPVGAWDSIKETDAGLEVSGRLLIDTVEKARELHALIKAKAVTGLSIGFTTRASTRKGKGRSITALDLVEISLVTVPCHPGARVTSAKSASEAIALAEAINRTAMRLRNPEGK
jgi:HK97 family phage prohead protease